MILRRVEQQAAVGVEHQLGVVEAAVVALVDADDHDRAGPARRCAEPLGGGAGDDHRLLVEPQVVRPRADRGFDEGEVRVVGDERSPERRRARAPARPASAMAEQTFSVVPSRLYKTGLIWTAAALILRLGSVTVRAVTSSRC